MLKSEIVLGERLRFGVNALACPEKWCVIAFSMMFMWAVPPYTATVSLVSSLKASIGKKNLGGKVGVG